MTALLTATDPVCGHVAAAMYDPAPQDKKTVADYIARGLVLNTKVVPDDEPPEILWCPLSCPQRAIRRAAVAKKKRK